MSLIERVAHYPGVPMSVEQRRQRFEGVVKNLYSADELALKRKHGRHIQAQLFAARRYEAEQQATAEPVNPEYEA